MKNICFFEGDMSRGGGTERMTAIIANELANTNKYNVIIVSLYNNSGSYFKLNKKVKHLSVNSQNINDNNSIINSIVKLRRILKKLNVDILINVDVMLGLFSIPAIMFSSIKLITWEHFNYMDDIGSRYTKYIRKISIIFSSYYIVLTKQDEKKFKSFTKRSNNIKQIYNTCLDSNDNSIYNSNSKIIMSAGNMFRVKGFDIAVDVGKKIFLKHPDWKWYIYGDGIESQNINKKINEFNLQNNIFIKKRTSCIDKAYKESSIFVLTSRMESFALVLLEAKMNNIPTVSFDISSGPNEIIEDNINGFLIKDFNIDEMAQKICTLIENEELRMMFSRNSKNNIFKFRLENIMLEWQKIIDSL